MTYKEVFNSQKGRDEIINIYDKILRRWKVSYEEFTIDTSFGRTFIIKSGDMKFPALILLHGTSSNSSMWIDEIDEFTKYFCVYVIDIPGEPGKSEEKQYSLKNSIYFEWLNEIINILNMEKVSITGISLGAWLAIGFSVKYPKRVNKLVLLCPSGIGSQKISFLLKSMPLILLGDWGYKKVAKIVIGNQDITEEAENYMMLIAKNFNLRTESVPIYKDEDLKKLVMPVYIITGENDVLLNSESTIQRARNTIPNVKTELLSEQGHVLIGQKKKIAEFLIFR